MADVEVVLKKKAQEGTLRMLRPVSLRKAGKIIINNKPYIDFSSNDYLGLSQHPKLIAASCKALDKFGTSNSASRLLSGDSELHHRLEKRLAKFKNKEAALVFNSGYQANIGIISALYGKDDCIFSDRLNHASLIDGINLSGAQSFRFRHNDTDHLELLIKKERGNFKKALIITESIFSMDGDKAPLKKIVRLKEKYDCEIFLDEAHATGVFGPQGSGLAQEEGVEGKVDFIMGTFSKALGSFGAYLAASEKTIDYLINTCRSFIYSTALPPAVIAANLAGIELIKEEPGRREKILKLADYFRKGLLNCGFEIKGYSQIVPLIVGDNLKALELAKKLQNAGFWVLAIRPPSVPKNEARLRFCLTFYHEKEDVDRLIRTLS
ncbi:MAG: 8-amino-7-oxononanoate synthase [Candidatus Omnitrophota bacterium]|jgi:8-amino-7-oxononanoate synthase